MTADCLPVLFCNRAGTEVAAAHAGWRGLCAGVLEETVACFADKPENIIAWLGPAIGPNAFEVGPEVRAAFMAKDPQAALRIREILTQDMQNPRARFVEMSLSRTGFQVSRS